MTCRPDRAKITARFAAVADSSSSSRGLVIDDRAGVVLELRDLQLFLRILNASVLAPVGSRAWPAAVTCARRRSGLGT